MQPEPISETTQPPDPVPKFSQARILTPENPMEHDEGFEAGPGKDRSGGMIHEDDLFTVLETQLSRVNEHTPA